MAVLLTIIGKLKHLLKHIMSTEKENTTVKDNLEEVLDDAIENVTKDNQEIVEETAEEVSDENLKSENATDNGKDSNLETLSEELQKEKDKFLRLFAEFENYKKRTGKERMDLFKTANQEMMSAMLPILDDFDRAQAEISKAKDKNLSKGIELIHSKFRETLKAKGLKEMEVKVGDTFNADIHEAITQIPAPKDKLKGKIVDVVEKGYKLGERIIRFPKVVTGM